MAISIFLSHPRPINEAQQIFIKKLAAWLRRRDLAPRTLGITDYHDAAPLDAIGRLMVETNGLLCVGFRTTRIMAGERLVRVGQSQRFERKVVRDEWLTTPWAQIEPAMAYQRGLPVVTLRETGVRAEGVLDRGVVGQYMPEFDLAGRNTKHYLDSSEWTGVGGRWEQHVRNVVANKAKPPKMY